MFLPIDCGLRGDRLLREDICLAKFDAHSRATQGKFSETYKKKNNSDG